MEHIKDSDCGEIKAEFKGGSDFEESITKYSLESGNLIALKGILDEKK